MRTGSLSLSLTTHQDTHDKVQALAVGDLFLLVEVRESLQNVEQLHLSVRVSVCVCVCGACARVVQVSEIWALVRVLIKEEVRYPGLLLDLKSG